MAQWRKHSPSPSDVGWFSLLLVLSFAPRGFFFGYSVFPLSLKKQHFQIPIRLGIKVDVIELNTFKFTHWLVSLSSSLLSSPDKF